MEPKRSWWQKIRKPLGVVGIIAACVLVIGLIVAIIGGYHSNWEWTGFNNGTSQITITSTSKVNYTATIPQSSKTLWDWLQLLAVLAIPVVVGFGVAWFTTQQGKVADAENKDNQREKALQDYIDKMSELLLEKNLRNSAEEDEVRKIARVRTITILFQLDARRIGYVFAFLLEAGLMSTKSESIVDFKNADFRNINFSQANLSHTNLSKANLINANLQDANLHNADLQDANLREADLSKANLQDANLSKALSYNADLSKADLRAANLSKAHLQGANLSKALLVEANLSEAELSGAVLREADLSKADLTGAQLRWADLREADLSGAKLIGANFQGDGFIFEDATLSKADLRGADLTGALITDEQLAKAKSLKGATMPDGTIHP